MKHPARTTTVPFLAIALLAAAAVVHAHTMQTGSHPADGATLETAPERVAVQFNAPVRITRLVIEDARQERVPFKGSLDREAARRHEAVPGRSLSPGRYTVSWRGMSEDGHVMSGQFRFVVR